MAERIHCWIERWLECGPIYFSVYLPIYLSILRYIWLPVYLSTCLPVYLSFSLSAYLSICLPIYLSYDISGYLSTCLPVYLSICLSALSAYLSICLPIYLSVCLSVCLPLCLLINLSINQSTYLYIYLSVRPSIYLLIHLSSNQFCETYSKNGCAQLQTEAILWHPLDKWKVTAPKRRIPARLPQVSKLTTSIKKQFCETSFKNAKMSAELTALSTCILRFFSTPSL